VTLPGLPVPRTWSPGDLVLVPRLRADLEQAVALLAQRPHLVAQCTGGNAIVSATDSVVPLDSELTDFWGAHLPGSADFWAPLPGWYLCDARMPFAYVGSTAVPLMAGWSGLNSLATIPLAHGAITVNGSTSQTVIARAVDLLPQTLTGPPNGTGDLIQPFARQDSGSTVNLQTVAADLPTVSIRWACALSGTQPLPVPPLTGAPTPITAAWLNANLRDAIRFLSYPPVAKAHYTAGSSTLASGSLASPAIVPLTTVDVDTYGGMTTGASAHYTAPVSGRYLLAGQFNLASSSTTQWHACGVRVNGTTAYWGGITRFSGSSLAGGAAVTKRLRLNAGDTVQLIGTQSSGSPTAYNTTASNQTRLICVWEGA
jgi:hypothetical protein